MTSTSIAIDIEHAGALRGSLHDAVCVASNILKHRRNQLSAAGRLAECDRVSRSIDALTTAAGETNQLLIHAIEDAHRELPDHVSEDTCDMAVSTHSRARGHSAAAALAYQCGIVLRDSRTGELHDHSSRSARGEIAATGIVSSRPTPIAADEQTLADAIESAGQRRDSRLLRDIKIRIPQLDPVEQVRLSKSCATAIAEHFDTIAAWELDAPSSRRDSCTWRCHVKVPTRSLSDDGQTLGACTFRDADAVAALRALVGDVTNDALGDAEIDPQ